MGKDLKELLFDLHIRGCNIGNQESNCHCDKIKFDVGKKIKQQNSKEIFDRLDGEIRVLKRRFKVVPKEVEVFLIDYELEREKHLGER